MTVVSRRGEWVRYGV